MKHNGDFWIILIVKSNSFFYQKSLDFKLFFCEWYWTGQLVISCEVYLNSILKVIDINLCLYWDSAYTVAKTCVSFCWGMAIWNKQIIADFCLLQFIDPTAFTNNKLSAIQSMTLPHSWVYAPLLNMVSKASHLHCITSQQQESIAAMSLYMMM